MPLPTREEATRLYHEMIENILFNSSEILQPAIIADVSPVIDLINWHANTHTVDINIIRPALAHVLTESGYNATELFLQKQHQPDYISTSRCVLIENLLLISPGNECKRLQISIHPDTGVILHNIPDSKKVILQFQTVITKEVLGPILAQYFPNSGTIHVVPKHLQFSFKY